MSVGFRRDGESKQNGLGEGIFDRLALGCVGARGTEGFVRLHQQHLGPNAMELDQASVALLSAIQAEVVRAEAGGESGGVKKFGVEARNLQPERAGALLPVKREIAVEFLHAGGALLDGRDAPGGLYCAARGSSTLGVENSGL